MNAFFDMEVLLHNISLTFQNTKKWIFGENYRNKAIDF